MAEKKRWVQNIDSTSQQSHLSNYICEKWHKFFGEAFPPDPQFKWNFINLIALYNPLRTKFPTHLDWPLLLLRVWVEFVLVFTNQIYSKLETFKQQGI